MGGGDSKLNDSDRLIRHCHKRYYRDGNVTSFKVFCFTDRELNEDCPFLSFSWLEDICRRESVLVDTAAAIDILEGNFPRDITKDKEAWIILTCGHVKAAILRVRGAGDPKIRHIPDDDNPSHVGVSGYEKKLHKKVASKLFRRIRSENVYPVTRTRKKAKK